MDFLDKRIEEYTENHTSPESEVLIELDRDTNMNILIPRMLSGHLQGRVLSMLSKMIQPKTILEIGTYTGYSAICLAEGLKENGKLYTIDINEELEDMARSYFEKANITKQVDFRIGNALDIIPEIKEDQFDLVFIDADKNNYLNYYELVIDRVNSGGYIIADNVLWSGKVTMETDKMDPDTFAINEFNKHILADSRVENVLFPIRDGLMVIRKK